MTLNIMDRKFITRFLEKYKSLPSLWKVKSEEYKNKGMKQVAYLDLLSVTKQFYPEADVEFVKKKINNLRTAFRKEYRKYQLAITNGNTNYMPSLWYYDMLYFTADQDPLDDDDNDYYGNISVSQGLEIDASPQYDYESEQNNSRVFERPRKRLAEDTEYLYPTIQNHRIEPPPQPESSGKDHYDAFGMYVAAKLRSMDKQQRLYTENVINQALFHGSIQGLSTSSTVTTPQYNQVSVGSYCQMPSLTVANNDTNIKSEQLD